MPRTSGEFKFHRHDSIGANAAEQDEKFLETCFYDTGDAKVLLELERPEAIVLGRTGIGKTALLNHVLGKARGAFELPPSLLSFEHIANTVILPFLEDNGVNLTVFLKLLWRHVIAVQILRRLYPDGKPKLLSRMASIFRKNSDEEKALKYLNDYGEDFWLSADEQIKEIVEHLETDIAASVNAEVSAKLAPFLGAGAKSSAELSRSLTKTQKSELVQRGRHVIHERQLPLLQTILGVIDALLTAENEDMYIVIDRLDEEWVEGSLRYKLLSALISSVRDFNHHVKNLKVLVGLRTDLYQRIFQECREAGHQEEKFRSLCLAIEWTEDDLIEMMNRRIRDLVSDRYTKATISHSQLFPRNVSAGGQSSKSTPIKQYLVTRTWKRPRDIIEFVNTCIKTATDKSRFTKTTLQAAERVYSQSRFQSLIDEWNDNYPGIEHFILFLKGRSPSFRLGDIDKKEWLEFTFDFLQQEMPGCLNELARDAFEKERDQGIVGYRNEVIQILYHIGVCGLKTDPHLETHWAHIGQHRVSSSEISDNSVITIHPALWRRLGIDPTGA